MSATYAAYGTLLKMGNGASPETCTTIAGLTDINGPKDATETTDTTTHNNAASDSYRRFIATLQTGGDVTVKIIWDPNDATHGVAGGLYAVKQARTTKNWQITFPSAVSPAVKISFSGPITSLGQAYPLAGVMTSDLTIKVSGPPVLA